MKTKTLILGTIILLGFYPIKGENEKYVYKTKQKENKQNTDTVRIIIIDLTK